MNRTLGAGRARRIVHTHHRMECAIGDTAPRERLFENRREAAALLPREGLLFISPPSLVCSPPTNGCAATSFRRLRVMRGRVASVRA